MAPKTAIKPNLFDPLPGQFAIRTRNAGTFVTSKDLTEVDALTTPSKVLNVNNRFSFEGYLSPPTHIKTYGGYYVIAEDGGGFTVPNDLLTFSTIYTTYPTTNWGFFEIHGPDSTGLFTITTLTGNYVTAVDGGGQTTKAFHTNATVASTWEQFYITAVGNLGSLYSYAIRPVASGYIGDAPAEYGRDLSATAGGGLTTGNAIQAVYGLGITTRFKLVLLSNGLYAIQTSNGVNYVTADQGGGLAHGSSSDGNLQTNRVAAEAWEQFEFLAQADGTYAIKTSSGFYVGVEESGVNISTRISDLNAAYGIGYTAKFELVMLPD